MLYLPGLVEIPGAAPAKIQYKMFERASYVSTAYAQYMREPNFSPATSSPMPVFCVEGLYTEHMISIYKTHQTEEELQYRHQDEHYGYDGEAIPRCKHITHMHRMC